MGLEKRKSTKGTLSFIKRRVLNKLQAIEPVHAIDKILQGLSSVGQGRHSLGLELLLFLISDFQSFSTPLPLCPAPTIDWALSWV